MSDAIISVVAERVLDILEEQIRYEVNLVRGVEKEVLDLSNKLKTIRSVLDDAEKRGVNEQSVKNWLKKLEDVAYEMDDILDEWSYALLKHKMDEGDQSTDPAVAPAKQKVCCSFITSSSCLCFKKVGVRRETAKKIENVKSRIGKILKEKDDFKFEPSLPKNDPMCKPQRVQSTSSIELGKVHGLDIDRNKNDIVRKLLVNGDSEILSIVGMGGLGKTTLAQLVYNDSQVKDSFDLRIWICVSDPFNVDGIARGVVNSVGKETIPQGTNQLELVLQKLRNSILGKKFLLVLDDVWTEDYDKWEPLKVNLNYGAAGCKVLVTTRNIKVAKMMGSLDHHIYHPKHLNDDECWSLLRRISLPGRSEEECGEFEDVGKKIASKCKGLPLAANVLGSLLQFKKSLEEWDNVWKSEIWRLEKAEVDLFPHLLLSYDELSPDLKRCFSYCAVYPKDYQIKARSLIEEWMALGYLGSVTGNGGVEVKGQDYFNNLAMRSFFQVVEISDDGDEQIESCKIHDVVHDFALFLRKNDDRILEGPSTTKRNCQDCNPLLVSRAEEYRSLFFGEASPTNHCDCLTSLRVLRFEGGGNGTPLGMEKLIHLRWLDLSGTTLYEEDLKIICRLYFLQTLLLSCCSLEEIPSEIQNLVHLRRLDLSYNEELEVLPENICCLLELQILNVQCCSCLDGLPEEIHRLRNLQHLLIDASSASHRLPQGVAQLSGLRTLGSFCVGSGYNKFGLLKNLNRLGSLVINIFVKSINDLEELVEDAREAELRNKVHIQKLEILFDDSEEEWLSLLSSSLWTEVIEALEPSQKMKELIRIVGYRGPRLPHWISSPLNLIKYIVLTNLNAVSSLPAMGKLPFLEDLCLQKLKELKVVGREFLGIESSSSSSSSISNDVVAFPKLIRLTFDDFSQWWEWEDITAEEEESAAISIMPCLTELYINRCKALKKLPHGLLRKVSSSLQVLDIAKSWELQNLYGDKDGSPWRSISQNNPKLQLYNARIILKLLSDRRAIRVDTPPSEF